MSELTEDKAVLVKIAQMVMGGLPQTYAEFGHIFWDAFILGRRYEQLINRTNSKKKKP